MKIVGLHCPYCGGTVKFDLDTGIKHCFCIHCGQQMILDDEVIRTEHIERKIDEAKIREVDAKARVELEQLRLYEKSLDDYHRRKKTRTKLGVIWGILAVSLAAFGIIYYYITWDLDTIMLVCGCGGLVLFFAGEFGIFIPNMYDEKPSLPTEK